MKYFGPDFSRFFRSLEKNNSTAWFNDNRSTYEESVKKPFSKLVSDMIEIIHKVDKGIQIEPADAIFRINKDTRFSKDKKPYNTYMAANISSAGKKDKTIPGFYFQCSHKGILIIGGAYMVETQGLHQIRSHIGKNLKQFSLIVNDATFKKSFGTVQGEKSKRLPPDLDKTLMKEPLLANKQFYYSIQLPAAALLEDNLSITLKKHYLAGKPLNDFLKKALKSSK